MIFERSKMSERFPSYDQMDKAYRKGYVRPCIDGIRRGSAKCRAYCHYEEHPGFLTKKLIRKQRCIEKDCDYFAPKPAREKVKKHEPYNRSADILEFSNAVLKDAEGIKALRAEQSPKGEWIVGYAAVARYELKGYEEKISRLAGETVRLKDLNYSYENAAKILFSD